MRQLSDWPVASTDGSFGQLDASAGEGLLAESSDLPVPSFHVVPASSWNLSLLAKAGEAVTETVAAALVPGSATLVATT